MAHGQGRYDNYKKKSGQIPRFGEWDEANEMPITQYFENPRQAGLLRNHNYTTTSSSSTTTSSSSSSSSAEALKLASHRPRHHHPSRQTAGGTREKRGPQRRVRDVSAQTDKYYIDVNGVKQFQNDVAPISKPPKPVDEDLYKIPPELINSSTRKRRPSFLACLVPCA
ncbi:PREDICTED: ubiquitin hydrolase B-like isoform X1 [Camelina sativa]|uniref:Ubiquitin hydrolase B-like isoform X1 n=2 Tax=Camelina sativa TaxID=90675 RepID=A0ABM0VCA5_CAMSA|nr:PREDICTED: ubiquitin hydrolase B-like isoform X1 [Camelina sativa]